MATLPHKQRAAEKTAPIKFHRATSPPLAKPQWIRASLGNSQRFTELKELLRAHALHTVCEEARCPNIGECFSSGTATFMILGDVCTRRCVFCDVAHGRPLPPDTEEPARLAQAVRAMRLNYVVITSVDRDDLPDGGASHFSACVRSLREQVPGIRIEILVPDFRGRLEKALVGLGEALPDVLNHNLETVQQLYPQVRPGSNYQHSLALLSQFKARYPKIPTKSGLMVGLGETDEQLLTAIADLRTHQVDRLTVGQYLSPSRHHHPVMRYVPPETFAEFKIHAEQLGFAHAECGPLVRSSYHAQKQDQPVGTK